MIRSCVSCRKQYSATKLLPVALSAQGVLAIHEKKTTGRRAWVCWSASCLRSLEKNPNKAARSLRAKSYSAVGLLSAARNLRLQQVEHRLKLCHHSGAVRTVQTPLINSKQFHLLLLADTEERSNWQHPKVYYPQKSPQGLGKMIGCGPRNVLGIIRNRFSMMLEEDLQIYDELH